MCYIIARVDRLLMNCNYICSNQQLSNKLIYIIHTLLQCIKFDYANFRSRQKRGLQRAFLACFAVSANTFWFYRHCMYIVFILQCHKSPRQLPNFTEKSRINYFTSAIYCYYFLPFQTRQIKQKQYSFTFIVPRRFVEEDYRNGCRPCVWFPDDNL